MLFPQSALYKLHQMQVPPNKPDGFATIASNPLRVQFIHNLGQAKNDSGNPVSPVVDFTLAKDLDHLNIYASTTQGFSLNYNSTTNKVTNSGFQNRRTKSNFFTHTKWYCSSRLY